MAEPTIDEMSDDAKWMGGVIVRAFVQRVCIRAKNTWPDHITQVSIAEWNDAFRKTLEDELAAMEKQ